MGQAVSPFLEYVVLQLVVMVVGLNVVHEKELSTSGVLKSWIFGQMMLFAVLQIIAVPMILLRWKFNALFWCYLGVRRQIDMVINARLFSVLATAV